MKNRYNYWPLLVFILLICSACQKKDDSWQKEAAKIQSAAVQWLVKQQADDGGWHSDTHGILKGGVAFTAYITDALVECGDSSLLQNDIDIDRAILFLTSNMDSSGAVGYAGRYVVEYPVYATAYTYKIFQLKPWVMDTLLAPSFLDFLLEQ